MKIGKHEKHGEINGALREGYGRQRMTEGQEIYKCVLNAASLPMGTITGHE